VHRSQRQYIQMTASFLKESVFSRHEPSHSKQVRNLLTGWELIIPQKDA
jgi:hypothetical protein